MIFYFPIAVWTWSQSGSPFGPLLADFWGSSVYPEGWSVDGSDAAGTLKIEPDTETGSLAGVVRVTTPRTGGTHTVCLHAKGAPTACAT